MMPGDRGGYSLVEALVAFLLLALLLSLVARTAAAGRRALAAVAISAERVDAARTTRRLLTQLQPFSATASVGPGAGELTVRMPIGWAAPCPTRPEEGAPWMWEGLRLPVPGRDSVLVLDALGASHLTSVAHVGAQGQCDGGISGRTLTISTDPGVTDAVLMHLWEPAVVRLDDALRYARSGSSRQPLTSAVLDHRLSGVSLSGGVVTGVVATDSLHLWRGRWRAR